MSCQVIQRRGQEQTVVVTTHSMEEAIGRSPCCVFLLVAVRHLFWRLFFVRLKHSATESPFRWLPWFGGSCVVCCEKL